MTSNQIAKNLLMRYLDRVNSDEWVRTYGSNYPEKKLLDHGDEMSLAKRLKWCWIDECGSGFGDSALLQMALYIFPAHPTECYQCFGLSPKEIFDMFCTKN